MNEIEILKATFNKFTELINEYNIKVDELFLTNYKNKYEDNIMELFATTKKELNLNFNSEDAYELLEDEIKKAVEFHQKTTATYNEKMKYNANEELNHNYAFEYGRTGIIADDMFACNATRANEYIINNINEKFMSKFIDMIYIENNFLNRNTVDALYRKLYDYIEISLKQNKENVLNLSEQIDEFISTKNVLYELQNFIDKNKIREIEERKSISKSKNSLISQAIFGLTNELLTEVIKSLKSNTIIMSDVDEIIAKSGYKEISEDEFRSRIEITIKQNQLLSTDNIFDDKINNDAPISISASASKFAIFSNETEEKKPRL